MKFSDKHYNSLKNCIVETLLTDDALISLENEYKAKNLSETRFLWDIFWFSKWASKCREDYNEGDYKDVHIQTALKAIVLELKKEVIAV